MPAYRTDTPYHAVPRYLRAPTHAITVDVAGAGGTGSLLLTQLVRLHRALIARGQGGLHVRVFDPDTVSESNLVRQHFSVNQLGVNKAVALVSMINRVYGLQWEALPVRLEPDWSRHFKRFAHQKAHNVPLHANLLITCVDSVAARRQIDLLYAKLPEEWGKNQSSYYHAPRNPFQTAYYWLDLGNGKDYGQAVLGTWACLDQPDGRTAEARETWPAMLRPLQGWQGKLSTVVELYPDQSLEADQDEPSCSALESLARQDLTINQMTATFGMTLLWRLLTEPAIDTHGVFFNASSLRSYPLPIISTREKITRIKKNRTLRQQGQPTQMLPTV